MLAAPTPEEAEIKLKLWAKYSGTDGGYLENVVRYPKNAKVEQTLVLLKPDNFRFPSARPGQHRRHVLAHGPLHHRHQGPSHERRRGRTVLRTRSHRASRKTARHLRPARPCRPREGIRVRIGRRCGEIARRTRRAAVRRTAVQSDREVHDGPQSGPVRTGQQSRHAAWRRSSRWSTRASTR